ncbi:BA14K family protein [Rhizobium changzhiense]|uniref:Lectin-like protein BA14k n=1 Tax=Rhizobium changzhiense TaxID=2692317 RepID=A0ABR6A7S9_9HYPH|nr:BA14K family protein [Rhizobium changzhiense]MBA5802679.1 BA14K family protein [Rhizobium changzhiense]
MNRFAIVALSIATAFSGMPASAGPAFLPSPVQSAQPTSQSSDARIMTVGCNNFTNCPGQFSNNRRWYRNRHDYRDRRYYRDDRYGWDRRYDRRYRRHDNTGAIIGGLPAGGIIASHPRARAYGSSHADYCYSRYRSYRASDNTYQPNYGPRRRCR